MDYLRRLKFLIWSRKKPLPSQNWERLAELSLSLPGKDPLDAPCHTWERPAALSSSILSVLPLEILLLVVGYLPPESAAAFSLSCMHLKCLLGTQQFARVKYSTKNTLALLNLLALDLPDYIACTPCVRLHQMQNLREYNWKTCGVGVMDSEYKTLHFPACASRDRSKNTSTITNLFGTTAFRMAMKRYRQQPECTELLMAMSSEAAQIQESEHYIRQYREECRVVQGCLMHRLQSVHISPDCLASTQFECGLPFETICPHIKFRESEENIGIGIKRCQECQTEYRIDLEYFDGHGQAILFTRWKNLGPDPDSEVWLQHLPSRFSPLAQLFLNQPPPEKSLGLRTQLEGVPENGGLSSTYENGTEYKFDSLMTPDNKTKLLRFQKESQARLVSL